MKLPVSRRWAFPPITPDPQHLDHYITFSQLTKALKFSDPDEHLKNNHCEKCQYVFTSENDKERHFRLIHGGIKSRTNENSNDTPYASKKMKVTHKCPVCSETFVSRYQLKNHKLGRGRPKKL